MTSNVTVPTKKPVRRSSRKEREAAERKTKIRSMVSVDVGGAGQWMNANIARTFSNGVVGETAPMEILSTVTDGGDKVVAGDLSGVERMLHGQLVALNSLFAECVRRAGANMGEHMPAMEAYLRLGLRAQAQCARTAEVLGGLKVGPTIIAKQANVTTGPQQVNNGTAPPLARDAFGHEIRANELLERSNGERLDTRAASQASRGNQALETVGTVDRADEQRRQNYSSEE